MFILDTNALSEMRKINADRADQNVTAWTIAQDAGSLFLSAITPFEIEIGVLRLERRDPTQGAILRSWLEDMVLQEFKGRILPIDTAVARQSARLHVPDPRADRDAMIAATGLVHSMTIVTRNTRDFEGTGVKLLNPWEAA